MNKNYLSELKQIQEMTNKIRKISINENIQFADNNEYMDESEQELPNDEPNQQCSNGECDLSKADSEEMGMEELDKNGSLDTIREITLKGMTKLCKTPENPEFQALLKIFQICNKGAEPKDDKEKNI